MLRMVRWKRSIIVLFLAACLLTQLRLVGRDRQRQMAQERSLEQLLAAAEEDTLRMRGIVDTCSTTEENTSVVLRTLAVETDGTYRALDEPGHGASCTTKKKEEALLPGDEIEIKGTLCIPEEARNPGAFDSKAYYSRLDIVCQLTGGSILSKKSGPGGIRPFLYRLRRRLCASLTRILPEKEAGSMMAIALGEKKGMDAEIKALYQESGIAHITSVSGLHATVVGMGAYRLLRWLCLGIVPASLLSGGLLLAYVVLTGSGIAALRAFWMFALWLLAQVLGRKYDGKTAAMAAASLLLLQKPEYLRDTSFLLSFAAMAVILWLLPVLQLPLSGYAGGKRSVRYGVASTMLSSAGIWIGMLPVTLFFFYQTPLYGMVLNVFLVPLLPVLMQTGLLGAVLGLCSQKAGMFFAAPVYYLLSFLERVIQGMLQLPGAVWVGGRPSMFMLGGYYGVLTLFSVLAVCRQKKAGKRACLWLLGLPLVLLFLIRPAPAGLEVLCMDVGQGDGALIRLPDGMVFLIDGGSSSEQELWERQISQTLKYYGIRTIDAIFLSHADLDHVSGILEFLEAYELGLSGKNVHGITLGHLILPPTADADDFRKLSMLAWQKGIAVSRMEQGMVLGGEEWSIAALAPKKEHLSGDANEDSLVLLLRYGTFRMLFTGDLEKEAEQTLAETAQGALCADVLKVGHHGSANGSSEMFLLQVQPKAAVISCGRQNRYGHPAAETVRRLKESGSTLFSTAEGGAIQITSDGSRFWIRQKNPKNEKI